MDEGEAEEGGRGKDGRETANLTGSKPEPHALFIASRRGTREFHPGARALVRFGEGGSP